MCWHSPSSTPQQPSNGRSPGQLTVSCRLASMTARDSLPWRLLRPFTNLRRPSSRVSTKRTSFTTVRSMTSSRCCTVSAGFPHFDMNAQWSDPQPVSRTPHKGKQPHPGFNADLAHSGWIQMGQGPLEIATGAARQGSTAEKEKDDEGATLLLWQRHARQLSPASDTSNQENASRAVGSESALLPMVSVALASALP